MRIIRVILHFVAIFIFSSAWAQVPSIAYYPGNLMFRVPDSIAQLTPVNFGGAVPATVYGMVTTYAGSGTAGSTDGILRAASFSNPAGLVFDSKGNLFVADKNNNRIRKISATGQVTTFAGSGAQGSVNGPASSASFYHPVGLAIDKNDNIFVADSGNNKIRKITQVGVVSTFAGDGMAEYYDGISTDASFNGPTGVAVDTAGYVYVADRLNNVFRKITPTGVVSRLAGSGVAGIGMSPAQVSQHDIFDEMFYLPYAITIDYSHKLDPAMVVVSTDQGNNQILSFTQDELNYIGPRLGFTQNSGNDAYFFNINPSKQYFYNYPAGVVTDNLGNIYTADRNNEAIKIDSYVQAWAQYYYSLNGDWLAGGGAGLVGNVDGIGRNARFNGPSGLALDGKGTLYVSDSNNNLIRKITLTGYVISPSLPAGLNFDPTTGVISGKATEALPPTNYTVGAFNAYGYSTALINIQINGVQPSVITFESLADEPVAVNNIIPQAASTNTETPITFTSSNPAVAVVNPDGTIQTVGLGTAIITANQTGDQHFTVAQPVTQILHVVKQEVIHLNPIITKYITDADFDPKATSNVSVYPITYVSSNSSVATIVNGQVHIVGLGEAVITASQQGDSIYVKAAPVSQEFTVLPVPLNVPNAITPNGDGINDTWYIGGIAAYPQCVVNIFNRYGTRLFHSVGYPKPWDGTYNGSVLPDGTYYYVIDPKGGIPLLSGSLTIIR